MPDNSLTKEEADVLVIVIEHFNVIDHSPEPELSLVRTAYKKLQGHAKSGDEWKALALQMYERDPCHYDHNDYCQEHYYEQPCPHGVISDHLKENDATG